MSADEVLNLIKQARQERREDLQQVIDSHVGTTATTILLFNQARLAARLTDSDPNSSVDVMDDEVQSPDPTTQPTEASL